VSLVCLSGRAYFGRRTQALRWLAVFLAACAAASLNLAPVAAAQKSEPKEYEVKAVYLYNFGRFVQWPDRATKDDTFAVCVLGSDPFGAILDATVANETIDNRKLVARRVAKPGDAAGCRILFISSSETRRIEAILAALQNSSVLTVSDMPGFITYGGMIQFVLAENKVRFQVNLAATDKAGLTFSSQLLKVATYIKRESPAGNVNP
jgi:hypothetical protein